ncbi:MAG: hypothetical protein ABS81_07440 [Pseudonocardia sp. SCN 72-86]|nr:MAG: hypothetical protein ABS81_07440 [Pseudonocardia sp. SCN 72-86]
MTEHTDPGRYRKHQNKASEEEIAAAAALAEGLIERVHAERRDGLHAGWDMSMDIAAYVERWGGDVSLGSVLMTFARWMADYEMSVDEINQLVSTMRELKDAATLMHDQVKRSIASSPSGEPAA